MQVRDELRVDWGVELELFLDGFEDGLIAQPVPCLDQLLREDHREVAGHQTGEDEVDHENGKEYDCQVDYSYYEIPPGEPLTGGLEDPLQGVKQGESGCPGSF